MVMNTMMALILLGHITDPLHGVCDEVAGHRLSDVINCLSVPGKSFVSITQVNAEH